MSGFTYDILKGFAILVIGMSFLVGGIALSDLNDKHPKECKILGMILLICLVLAAITFLVCDCTGLIPHPRRSM